MHTEHHNDFNYSKYRPKGYPVRHKRKIPFEPILSLPIEYRSMIRRIRELDGVLDEFILGSDDYLELVKEAFANNIHWSTKIEGNKLSLEEVMKLTGRFTRKEITENNNGPTQEILNHLYSFFAKNEMSLPWNKETVTKTHAILMRGVSESITPGVIRTEDVSIIGSDGTEFFITCPPKYVEDELDSILEWLNTSPYDEIITATLLFHEFESIHPFKDGNGRAGRTLFQILLQELGLKNCKLCKFEEEMLSDPETYYDLLAYTDSTQNYAPIVMYFTEALLRAYENAVIEFSKKDRLLEMDENTRMIVRKAKEVDSFTFKEAITWVPGIGIQALRKKMDELVDMDILIKVGMTKSMRYMFKDPLRDLRAGLSLETKGYPNTNED